MMESGGTILVGVHGVGNFQRSATADEGAKRLTSWWRTYADLGDSADIDVYYYAHRLRRRSAQSGIGVVSDPILQDVGMWARELGYGRMVAEGRLSAPLRSIAGWVADKYGLDQKLTTLFVARFFGEVHDYFTLVDKRISIQDGLLRLLSSRRPRIVVAHSLGSVVAYETLKRADDDVAVELLLTLGSPLAMPGVVLDRLEHGASDRGRPRCVQKWINVADVGDIVAIPAGGVGEQFSGVDRDTTDRIHAFDFHRVEHYLKCGVVRGILASRL